MPLQAYLGIIVMQCQSAYHQHGHLCSVLPKVSGKLSVSGQQSAIHVQGGSLQYHQGSLRNLAAAVKQEKKLCAIMVDTTGRQLLIRRQYTLNDQVGWESSAVTLLLHHP